MSNSSRKLPLMQLVRGTTSLLVLSASIAGANAQIQQVSTQPIDIEAMPLEAALNELAQQIDKQIVVYSEDAAGLIAPELDGAFTEVAALDTLLEGTDLRYTFLNERTIAVAPQARLDAGQLGQDSLLQLAQLEDDTPVPAEDDDARVLDTVRVPGFRSSLASSLELKRNADQVIDAISAEDIGQFPDQNLAESIQRIAGVQITRNNGEGETVNIRGLSANFTRVEVDGRSTSVTIDSSDPERQSVLSVFSSDLYNTIEVIKSPTAADVEGGVGGIVRLSTPDPLDIGVLSWGGDLGYVDGDVKDEGKPNFTGFYSNVFGDGNIGLLVSGTYEERDRRIDKIQSNQNWLLVEEGDLADDTDPDLLALVGARYPRRLRQEQREGEATKFNINAKLQWQATPDLMAFVDTVFTSEDRNEDRDRFQSEFARGNLLSGERDGDDLVVGEFEQARTEFASFARDADITTSGITAGFEYDWDDFNFKGEVSMSESEEDLTEIRASTRINSDSASGYSIVNDPEYPEIFSQGAVDGLADLGSLDTRQLDIERRIINIQETAASFDVENFLDGGNVTSVEAGLRYASTEFDRKQGFQDGGDATYADGPSPFVIDGSFADGFGGDLLTEWPSVDPVALLDAFPPTGDFSFDDNNLYNISEDVWAAYALANYKASPFGLYARGNVGARAVMTDYSGEGRVRIVDENGDTLPFIDDAAALEQSYSDILPAVNLVVSRDATSNLLMRGAITRALSRPEVENLNPATTINLEDNEISQGNPDLDPFRAWQYDLGVEWYFGENGESAISAAVFYKDIETFVFSSTEQLVGATFPEFGLDTPMDYELSTFANGGDAKVQGFEVGVQAPFTFLPGFFSDFGGFANYTYTDSEFTNDDGVTQPFPGASENAFNLVGYYERGGFSSRLAYNYRDEFLIIPAQTDGGTANAEFGDSQGRLDFAVRYRFDNGVRVSFDALNLTEEQNYKYYDTTRRLEDLEVEGRIYQVSLGYKF